MASATTPEGIAANLADVDPTGAQRLVEAASVVRTVLEDLSSTLDQS